MGVDRLLNRSRQAGRSRAAHVAPPSTEWSSHLPRAAAVGALGVTLVLAPILGANGASADDDPSLAAAPVSADGPAQAGAGETAEAAPETAEAAPEPTPSAPVTDVDFRVTPASGAETPTPAVVVPQPQPLPVEQLLALRADAELASRTHDRARLDGCSGQPPATQPANGRIDPAELCNLWDGQEMLRADAAVALAGLNARYFAQHGTDICITDSYRSYEEQVAVKQAKPGLAAPPGTSQHGWGLAIDVCNLQGYGGGDYAWLRDNAPEFGWDNPEWARSGGSGPNEPWHWEFVAGQPAEAPAG